MASIDNKELELAWEIISNTDTHIFLTGKAGTGKTTFLRNLRTSLPKRMVVVAPTGIAAINAQGTTIHSFFQLSFGPQIPGTQQKSKRFQFRKQKIQLIRSLDLIVIDEISMVRADTLDAIDHVLRQYRNSSRPFGGVQMLMIGDMQQLAPVAKEDEWRLLSPYYSSPYFFSSKVLQNTNFVTIELKHVYRQNDPVFIDLLNSVRNNYVTADTLKHLNTRYIPNFSPQEEEGYIRLTTHNYQADIINEEKLKALKSAEITYNASVEGDFPELAYPTDTTLRLKVGAQVMFVKNDSSPEKRYYNGMIGKVTDLKADKIIVCSTDDGHTIEVDQEKWNNIKYTLNEDTQEIEENVAGTFQQFPLKTAWAITIHKSQGLTFEHAIIDAQHSFAHGQTYVALSRCKTLEGLVLSHPIPPTAIISDNLVQEFCKDPRHQQPDAQHLTELEKNYYLRITEDLFSFDKIHFPIKDLLRILREFFYHSYPKLYTSWQDAEERLKQPEIIAYKFHKQYERLILNTQNIKDDSGLQDRLKKGAAYFKEDISFLGKQLSITKIQTNNKQARERLTNVIQNILFEYRLKTELLNYVAENGIKTNEYLKYKATISLKLENDESLKAKHFVKKKTK